jgi:hypothetical protein
LPFKETTLLKTAGKICAAIVMASALGTAQATTPKFPPEVMERKASVVNVTTIPAGGTVKVDGVPIPTMPFMLLKKDKPRVVRFELAGYKTLEKHLDPGVHYVIGVGVDFVHHQVALVEGDAPPNAPPTPDAPSAPAEAAAQPSSKVEEASASAVQDTTPKPAANPFGFEYGMKKEQVITKLGKTAVAKDGPINVVFNTAPSPHPDFESYVVAFSPEKGLLKITAVSRDIETSDDGSELRQKFAFFLDALRGKYGKADKDFDFCKGNDVECRSEYYMMTLKEKNRYLNSFWSKSKSSLPPRLTTVAIEAIAMTLNKGYIQVSYEFEGWNEFVDEINKKRNSTF